VRSLSLKSKERRTFLKLAGAAVTMTAAPAVSAFSIGRVAVVVDDSDPVIASMPVTYAVEMLRSALRERGILADGTDASLRIVIASPQSSRSKDFGRLPVISAPETVALLPGKDAVLVTGSDARGVMYGVLEMVDRVRLEAEPMAALRVREAIIEASPNRIRSVARAFCSEVEDKAWYYDKAFWTEYLDNLSVSRFNRFNFALGFGYDFPTGVTDDYFHFAYPYLVSLPGYEGVRVDPPLQAGERVRNLQMLQFIAAETARRGMQFQLGIWTHAYAWTDSPHSTHHIVGLTPDTHAAYCRDALSALLQLCPQITGVTLRVHGESGIPEGSYSFWQTLFEAFRSGGRKIEIDMHAKGINQIMIDMARNTGMPITVGAKYSAEHQSLPYHQADIREYEIPRPERRESGVFAVSNGDRRFTRYGYADLYQQGSGFDVLYRLWPGTQRHLLWGDPAQASGFGRSAHFCGAAGLEICEPLTFKGREGSGHAGGRNAYADATIEQQGGHDTTKATYTYRIWGRSLFYPAGEPEPWRRQLRHDYSSAAAAMEVAFGASGRILPLVTSAFLPSASNHAYWPEMFTTMAVVADSNTHVPYSDSPVPHTVGACSPLDPQIFCSGKQYIDQLAKHGRTDARYSPLEVAQWLEDFSTKTVRALEEAGRTGGLVNSSPVFRRAQMDLSILAGLGTFFAGLFRCGVQWEVFENSHDPAAGKLALANYRRARAAWSGMAERAKAVYVADVSYGSTPMRRGHWIDRLAAIDKDVAAMENRITVDAGASSLSAPALMRERVSRPSSQGVHAQPEAFAPGKALLLSLKAPSGVTDVVLWYRHVNHAERWKSAPMVSRGSLYSAEIPGEYSQSLFPLQYYFELRSTSAAWLQPAFDATLSNQPYYAVSNRS
jgi:hypothetical protein